MNNTTSSKRLPTTTELATLGNDTLAVISGGMRPTPIRPLYVTEIRTKHGVRGF